MKQSCPNCKTIVEINEKEYQPSEVVTRDCPLCDTPLVFNIPEKASVESEDEEIEELKRQLRQKKKDALLRELAAYENKVSADSEADEKDAEIEMLKQQLIQLEKRSWSEQLVAKGDESLCDSANRNINYNAFDEVLGTIDKAEPQENQPMSVRQDPDRNDERKKEDTLKKKACCFGIGVSFCFPLVGLLMFFFSLNSVKNPHAYLISALIGFLIWLLFKSVLGLLFI
ncbi:MAG: tripartite tricarboxylate transporter TctB family protein [Bacteroidales bacterium]|nr:tripartite tricarboxylate transporter TctB family protein [Candidatus Colimorpha onthohippi]